nr:hypothetical protein [Rhodoferax sp.]
MNEQIARINEARALITAALKNCDSPQIEMMLRNADMELHWALWNLGVVVSHRPELDRANSDDWGSASGHVGER